MSLIRFLHVDHLRLGSPLTGLADCPDWLRRLVENAVRRAMTSVVETAIAHRCQFLLIAGQIAESPEDMDLATAWLLRHQETLAEHGIRVVVAQQTPLRSAPGTVGESLVLPHGQPLLVELVGTDSVRLAVGMRPEPMSGGRCLTVEIGRDLSAIPRHSGLSYLAAPAVTGDSAEVLTSTDGCLRVTAGAPQALNSSESGAFGVRIVEADPVARRMTARFVPTDSIRFVRETIACTEDHHPDAILAQLAERSRQISPSQGRTLIADWTLTGRLSVSGMIHSVPDERHLLQRLRSQLQSGHIGVWPRQVACSPDCVVRAADNADAVLRDLLRCEAERRHGRRATLTTEPSLYDVTATGAVSTAVRLLSRAA